MDQSVAERSAAFRAGLAALAVLALSLVLWPRLHAMAIGWILSRHDTRHAVSVPPEVGTASVSLGSHALLGQEDGRATNPAVSSPVDTQASGSSFVIFNGGAVADKRLPTDNMGNIWTPLAPAVVFNGYDGAYDAKAYVALAGHGGSDHVVSILKDGSPTGELTLVFVEIRQARKLQDFARAYAASGRQVTSGSVTTTGPAVLLAVWWGDGYFLKQTAIPGDGFNIIENFVDLPPNSAVQCVVAYRRVDAAGTYRVTWQQSPQQGAILWLLAFEAGAASVTSANDRNTRHDEGRGGKQFAVAVDDAVRPQGVRSAVPR